MRASDIIDLLGLEALPDDEGYFTETWRDEHSSAIYYVMRAGNFSAMHRQDGPELWHHYAGAAVEMLLLAADGSIATPTLGDDLGRGQRPCVAVPAGTWLGAATTGDWSLVGTTMAPPFKQEDYELGDGAELIARYPTAADAIGRLVRDTAS